MSITAEAVAFSAADRAFMAEALELAASALWHTDPNPRVGCVIVKDGQVVGRGAHLRAGTPHAEVHALGEAGGAAQGATAYVTLEPCNHHGRTPPCSEALLAAGVARVVVAMAEDNPKAAGGIARLRAAGLVVEQGLLAQQSRELNIGFHQRCEQGRPWLRLKLAASLDGRTAAADGSSQWITGAEARADGQQWRARASMILTGAATVRADNPSLNVRLEGAWRQPRRVILSRTFDVAPDAHIFAQAGVTQVLGPASEFLDETARRRLQALQSAGRGCQQLTGQHLSAPTTRPEQHTVPEINLGALLGYWAQHEEVNEIHAECGAVLAGALLRADLVDEILLYQAPKLLGEGGRPLAYLPTLENIQQALAFRLHDCSRIGADMRLILRRKETECSAD